MLVGVYIDPRWSSDTSKFAESGSYEAFVVVHYCQLKFIQPQILTNKQDEVTIFTSFCSDSQLLLAALQKNSPWSVLLALFYYLKL